MDFQKFEYFMAIAKHRNLTKASQELYISQPTLTKFLQKLEQELGGKLFRRNGHNYDLTFLGQRYYDYAQKALTLNQDWEKELQDMRSSYEGELNIAFPPMRSVCILPKILPAFHTKHPGVRINIYEQGHNIQDSLLADGKLDFAIFSNWHPLSGLSYEVLTVEEILLILPSDHPLADRGIQRDGFRYPWLDLGLLADNPFILHFPDQNTGRAASQLFEQYHIQPPVHFRSRNNQLCIQLVSKGLGACFSPETYVQYTSSIWPLQAFSVGNPGLTNQLVLAYRQNSYLSTYAQDFITIARECLQHC
ncbi:MAG: LysR family transcriptional regulator [Lachnospiraceae bacterium]|nr:LysR family transcriptional regulator [Lachnospiraceae bacterium]